MDHLSVTSLARRIEQISARTGLPAMTGLSLRGVHSEVNEKAQRRVEDRHAQTGSKPSGQIVTGTLARLALMAILALVVSLAPASVFAKIDTVSATASFTFVPASLAVHYGDTVRWVNTGGTHTSTSDPSSTKAWDSGTMLAGQHFDVVFTAGDGPGPFPYHCTFHGTLFGMVGTISASAAGSCCVGKRGNVNTSGIVDLSDLSSLVSYLTGGGFVLPCVDAANVNGSGIVDLADLSSLVSYLTGGGFVLPNCP